MLLLQADSYIVMYTAQDKAGNVATATRTVNVVSPCASSERFCTTTCRYQSFAVFPRRGSDLGFQFRLDPNAMSLPTCGPCLRAPVPYDEKSGDVCLNSDEIILFVQHMFPLSCCSHFLEYNVLQVFDARHLPCCKFSLCYSHVRCCSC